MAQLITLIIFAVLAKLLMNYLKPVIHKQKSESKGDFIDISEKWIQADEMPYQKNDYLLAKGEMVIFRMLQSILAPTSYSVFPHLRLADLLRVPADTPNRQEYLFRIKERSLDMVIFESVHLKPMLVINLKSPNDGKRQQINDEFINNVLTTAGIKSLSISLSNPPAEEELLGELRNAGLEL
ncbi:MAG: DUF2726 domain-containing protein [Syntrophomonas sp.]|nr:DUF2726 domain-containing protein [Syntrophomonas sp.]